jgi:hypothetical protein
MSNNTSLGKSEMTNVQDICVDLNNFGDMLGGLTPTFGLKANASLPSEAPTHSSKKETLHELAKLGGMLSGLNPRDVSIWGQ